MLVDPPFVKVIWLDAWVDSDNPVSIEDIKLHHKPTVVETLGWLLLQDEEGLSIASERYEGFFRGRGFIPAGMLKSVTPYQLTLPKPKRLRRSKNETPSPPNPPPDPESNG